MRNSRPTLNRIQCIKVLRAPKTVAITCLNYVAAFLQVNFHVHSNDSSSSRRPLPPQPLKMPKPQKGQSASEFLKNLALGGSIGAVSKTIMSPVERVKILMQTMDSNPKVISGEVKPYTGTYQRRRMAFLLLCCWRVSLAVLLSCLYVVVESTADVCCCA